MLKKNFIGPAIFLLLAVIGYLVASSYFVWKAPYLERDPIWLIPTLLWPVTMLVETFLYWRIRKRNRLTKASWAHVCLFAFAFISFFIKGWIIEYIFSVRGQEAYFGFIRNVSMAQILIFWGSIIGGHIIFIRVLRKARTQKHLQPATDPANLLDDVLS